VRRTVAPLIAATTAVIALAAPAAAYADTGTTADLGIKRLAISQSDIDAATARVVVKAIGENYGPADSEPAIQVIVTGTVQKVTCGYDSQPLRRWSDGMTCEVYPAQPGIRLIEKVVLTEPRGAVMSVTARTYPLGDVVDPNPANDSMSRSRFIS
jgi:hypothetical protein